MTQLPTLSPSHWTRRPWCRRWAWGLILFSVVLNLIYLFKDQAIDLSEDECHYWEWARHLDYGYYSKGPGIAWLLWLTGRVAAFFGQTTLTMPVVRVPAVLLSGFSGTVSLELARRIFRDDRASLAVTLLSGGVPMFAIGSLLITIDAPMYACWALAAWGMWHFLETGQKRQLYLAGLATGVGILFKPLLVAFPLCMLVAAALNGSFRRRLASWHTLGALSLMGLGLGPMLLWNLRHGWVTFRHIGGQAGVGVATHPSSSWLKPLSRLGEYVGGQAGGLAGLMFVLLVIAVVRAWKMRRAGPESLKAGWDFLLALSLPLWLFYALLSLWTNTEVNWPAASYFGGMILLAGVVVHRWSHPGVPRSERRWVIGCVLWGLFWASLLKNSHHIYDYLARHPMQQSSWMGRRLSDPRRWDPIGSRVRGFAARAELLEKIRQEMARERGRLPLVATNRYDNSSSLAFYLPDQPFVFSLMSQMGGRQSQYDLWPGLNEKTPDGKLRHAGSDLILVGNSIDAATIERLIVPGFEKVGPRESYPVYYRGLKLRDLTLWRCYGFSGLPTAPASQVY